MFETSGQLQMIEFWCNHLELQNAWRTDFLSIAKEICSGKDIFSVIKWKHYPLNSYSD
jgi:hypothetical protein